VLRSLASGLCLDIPGGRCESGAAVTMAGCSTAGSQQWSYDQDGLLRSLTDPGLCLDTDTTARTVTLAGCLVHAGEVHYDLTVRGEFLLRWSQGLAVAPASAKAGARVVVTDRDGSAGQRWVLESGVDARVKQGEPDGKGEADGKSGVPGSGASNGPEPPEGAPQGDVPQPPPRTFRSRASRSTRPAPSRSPAATNPRRNPSPRAPEPVAATSTPCSR
jgi:hypothetical protein